MSSRRRGQTPRKPRSPAEAAVYSSFAAESPKVGADENLTYPLYVPMNLLFCGPNEKVAQILLNTFLP